MKRMFAAALCALALNACAHAPEPSAPLRDGAALRMVTQGSIEGFVDPATRAHVWRSVPFAAPPVGDLRWRAPRAPAPWQGVRDATPEAPWCPQVISALDQVPRAQWGALKGQEDCLYLNIYAPAMSADAAKTAKLPVMMWIHGGSNVWGRAAQYDGAALATRENVIVVVVQYRLGILGWMAHPALRADPLIADDASANFAQLDHIRALEWIRDEIAVFGGDNSRVTVFGESAGGHNVAALLASPRARGLFHRAIVQSGSFRTVSLEKAEGKEGDVGDTACGVASRLLNGAPATGAALRAAPLDAVYKATSKEREGRTLARVIADGVVLPKDGIEAAISDRARFNAVPVIMGSNRDEMKLFNALDPRLAKRTLGVFPQARDKALYEAMNQYPSRNWRATAVDRPATLMSKAGHTDVWTYRFDWDDQGRILFSDLSFMMGAAHSMEIPFVFGRFVMFGGFDRYFFNRRNEAGRVDLSNRMMRHWANFARTGDPGAAGDGAVWARFNPNPAQPAIKIFDAPGGGGSRMQAGQETQAALVGDLFKDRTLKNDTQRCAVFRVMRVWNDEMEGMDQGRCKA